MRRLRELWNRLFGYDVFISYSSHDEAWAVAVEKLLKHGRYSVFRDEPGLTAGDHLERLLREVRRSTMLLVLVSGAAMQSDWVHRELRAHLERPKRRWRVTPVFLEKRYPGELPERFRVLGEFHGVSLPIADLLPAAFERDQAFLKEATAHFDAVRQFALRGWMASATLVAVMTVLTSLVWVNRRNTQRDEWLTRAEGFMASSRFIDAEQALAHAWQLDPSASTLAAYRKARSHRALERPSWVRVAPEEGVVAVDEANGTPYTVVRSSRDRGGLFLLRGAERVTIADPCAGAPLVSTRGPLVVWNCGRHLGAMLVEHPVPRSIDLPAQPVALTLNDGTVDLLFHEGRAAQVGRFTVPALQPIALTPLSDAPAAGEMGFCASATPGVWSIIAENGTLAFRSWNRNGTPMANSAFTVPEVSGTGSIRVAWVSQVIAARNCDRFFVELAPFTLAPRSSFEMVRLRPDSPHPLDRFDGSVDALAPTPEASGIEAIYLTSSKELRAFVLTSPVMLTTRVRTLASDIERFAAWPSGDHDAWTIAAGRQSISIFHDQDLWSVYPLGVGDAVRVVTSRDGRWTVIEGNERTVLWRRAEPLRYDVPPSPESIAEQTTLPP
jgi:hypothetical protein